MCGSVACFRSEMFQEQEERRLHEQFDDYCSKNSLTLPLTVHDKKKLVQMIGMLEKLQKGNPQRYEMTLQKMGLNKILDRNSSETSIFDAILAFYGATKTNSPNSHPPATAPRPTAAASAPTAVKQQTKDVEALSCDIFDEIKRNKWDTIYQLIHHNSRGHLA
jgi:hypothetical protein